MSQENIPDHFAQMIEEVPPEVPLSNIYESPGDRSGNDSMEKIQRMIAQQEDGMNSLDKIQIMIAQQEDEEKALEHAKRLSLIQEKPPNQEIDPPKEQNIEAQDKNLKSEPKISTTQPPIDLFEVQKSEEKVPIMSGNSQSDLELQTLARPKVPSEMVKSVLEAPFMSIAQPASQMVYFKDENNRIHRGQFLQPLTSLHIIPETQKEMSRLHTKGNDNMDSARKPLVENEETCPDQLINNTNDTQFDEMKELKVNQLSLDNLVKHLEQYMPLNPQTKLSFRATAKITTHRFCCKLFNPFCLCLCRKQKNVVTPLREHEDIGVYLGEGTTLYLQMMKAFTIIFFILTILNVPIFMIYYENSKTPIIGDFHRFFSQFSLASVGESSQGCDIANLKVAQYTDQCRCNPRRMVCPTRDEQLAYDEKNIKSSIKLTCRANSLIDEINDFGLINFSDFDRGSKADPEKICQNIKSPIYSSEVFDILKENPDIISDYEKKVAKLIDYRSGLTNPNNIDKKCNFNTLFKGEDIKNKLRDHFRSNCIGQSSCMISPSLLSEMIADFTCDCRNRIGRQKTLASLMVVYKCSSDHVSVPYGLASKIPGGDADDTLPKIQMLNLISIIDLVCVFILSYCMMTLKAISNERLNKICENLVEMKDFVVQLNQLKVDKYSQDERILQMKLWLYLNEKCKSLGQENQIIDISFGSMKFGNMQLIFQMHRVKEQIKKLQAISELRNTTNKKRDQILIKQKELDERYEILSSKYRGQIRKNAADTNKFKRSKDQISFIDYVFVTFKNSQFIDKLSNEHFKFLGSVVKAENTPLDPDQIVWTSLTGTYSGFCKQILQLQAQMIGFIGLALLIVGVHLMMQWALKDFQKWFDSDYQCPSTLLVQDEQEYKKSLYYQKQDSQNKVVGELGCYCKYLHDMGMDYRDVTFQDINPADDNKYCKIWKNYEGAEFWIKFLVPVSVVVINSIVTNFYCMLVQWWIQSINTVNQSLVRFWGIVIYEILNIALMFTVATVFLDLWDQRHSQLVDLKDVFTHQWYLRLASSFATCVGLSALNSNLYDFFFYKQTKNKRYEDCDGQDMLEQIKRNKVLRDQNVIKQDKFKTNCRNQDQLNNLHIGPEFEIERAYARATAILFLVEVYSAGMPFLYPCAMMFLLITYLNNKFLCIRFYQRNTQQSDTLFDASLKVLLIGLILHVCLGFFMMTDIKLQRTFDTQDEDSEQDAIYKKFAGVNWSLYMTYTEIKEYMLLTRFHKLKRFNIFVYLVGGGVIAFISFIFFIVLCCCKRRRSQKTWTSNYLNEISITTLKSLYNRAHFDLQDFNSLFEIAQQDTTLDSQNHKLNFSDLQSVVSGKTAHRQRRKSMAENPKNIDSDQILQEICLLYQISKPLVDEYRTLLEQRIFLIEVAIDQYFSVIKPQLIKKKLAKLELKGFEVEEDNLHEEFSKYTFSQKLVQILKLEDEILKNNSIIRMRGCSNNSHSQSYSIFDNSEFRIAKEIYYELQKELENEKIQEDLRKIHSFEKKEVQIRAQMVEVSEHNSTPEIIEQDVVDYINNDIECCFKSESGLFAMPLGFKQPVKRQIGMDQDLAQNDEDRPAIKVPTQNKPKPGVPDSDDVVQLDSEISMDY